ncbi:hypothetical protein CONPUDRAFT_134194 [Coniophora puteana RWD-64-598 SS2]|uniref:Uncharacterized protein n=1 Tax=Coniophora puteana (strain RWD-64-598) TaxID=741705 RepID=A0A5M3N603_CONPW|nr:uncharacterized protein CONPUDRAFT_134194 [Coniophora puteana RWD-64-598 SS2]EIW86849.1 hypothetical protein CONPUDRAFT_134194 [Coniophora puteana RWD-64-598 SS2]
MSNISQSRLRLANEQYFTQHPNGKGLICTVCKSTRKGPLHFFDLKAAIAHERKSSEHKRRLKEAESWKHDWEPAPLTSEGLRHKERFTYVDQVHDLVPFWQRGIDAAKRGEVLRLEDFLEKMEANGGWHTADDVWDLLEPSKPAHEEVDEAALWGPSPAPWEREFSDVQRPITQSSFSRRDSSLSASPRNIKRSLRQPRRPEDDHAFVEKVARHEAADQKRRERMHTFFDMPTNQKVQKIQEMIQALSTA